MDGEPRDAEEVLPRRPRDRPAAAQHVVAVPGPRWRAHARRLPSRGWAEAGTPWSYGPWRPLSPFLTSQRASFSPL